MSKQTYLIAKAGTTLKQRAHDPEFMYNTALGGVGGGASLYSLYRNGGAGLGRIDAAAREASLKGASKPKAVLRGLRAAPTGYKVGMAVSSAGLVGQQVSHRRLARKNKGIA